MGLHELDPKLVSAQQLAEVAEASVEEFEAARWSRMRWGSRWLPAEDTLRRDLERCTEVLRNSGVPCQVKLFSLDEEQQHMWPTPQQQWGCRCCAREKHRTKVHSAASP